MCLGNNESANRRGLGKTREASALLSDTLVDYAYSAVKTKAVIFQLGLSGSLCVEKISGNILR